MMKTVRCKFVCNHVAEEFTTSGSQWRYKFNAVHGDTGENKVFWQFTPSGSLEFQCMNRGDHPMFVVGAEYFLDIVPAETKV